MEETSQAAEQKQQMMERLRGIASSLDGGRRQQMRQQVRVVGNR